LSIKVKSRRESQEVGLGLQHRATVNDDPSVTAYASIAALEPDNYCWVSAGARENAVEQQAALEAGPIGETN
jgi:hypothetical protein